MERRERAKRLQGVEQDRVDPLRRGKAGAAVNDPVADRDDLPVTKMVRGPCKQIFEQIGMGQRRPIRPVAVYQDFTLDGADAESGCNTDLFDLAACRQGEAVRIAERIERELDAR